GGISDRWRSIVPSGFPASPAGRFWTIEIRKIWTFSAAGTRSQYQVQCASAKRGRSMIMVWFTRSDDVRVVAGTYQFFTGSVPNAGGFEYLIESAANNTDLSDPYY